MPVEPTGTFAYETTVTDRANASNRSVIANSHPRHELSRLTRRVVAHPPMKTNET